MLSSPLSLPLAIGLRYLRAKRRNQFISFVSLFSLLGMGFGVFALLVVLSVMNGFDAEIKQRVLSVVPHGVVTTPGGLDDWEALGAQLEKIDGIQSSAPFIAGFGLVSRGYGVQGVDAQGIDPHYEADVSTVADKMLVGSLDQLESGQFGVVVGRLLAQYLGVTVGDKLVMILPDYSITPAGVFPRQKRLTIVGVFEVGAQQDQSLVLLNLDDARKLFRRTSVADGLRVKTRSIYEAPEIIATARNELARQGRGELELLDWSQTQGGLFQAVKMEKIVVGCLLMIIVAVAAFNIVTSLVLMVADKRSDIAVLRTMGMSRPQIMAVFIAQGSATGLIGMFFGALLGTFVAIYIGDIVSFIEQTAGAQLFDPSVYFVSRLPSVWLWRDALIVVTVGALLSLLATLYPAYQAAKIQPAEALRYE